MALAIRRHPHRALCLPPVPCSSAFNTVGVKAQSGSKISEYENGPLLREDKGGVGVEPMLEFRPGPAAGALNYSVPSGDSR
jgi:hypothetical protein